jgi:cystathionine beta-lyase/cystathionine gamma-synthase
MFRSVRMSIGLEDLEDLKEDFRNAFKALLAGGEKRDSKL